MTSSSTIKRCLDQVFTLKTHGVKVFGLISQPQAIERSARKTVRSLDGVLVPSPGIAEEIIHELGRTAIRD